MLVDYCIEYKIVDELTNLYVINPFMKQSIYRWFNNQCCNSQR
jgi:hypothetical protein